MKQSVTAGMGGMERIAKNQFWMWRSIVLYQLQVKRFINPKVGRRKSRLRSTKARSKLKLKLSKMCDLSKIERYHSEKMSQSSKELNMKAQIQLVPDVDAMTRNLENVFVSKGSKEKFATKKSAHQTVYMVNATTVNVFVMRAGLEGNARSSNAYPDVNFMEYVTMGLVSVTPVGMVKIAS